MVSDEKKKKVRVPQYLRNRLRREADKRDLTYDELLAEVLPEDVEKNAISYGEAQIDVAPEIHERLKQLAGDRVAMHEVIEEHLDNLEDEK